MISPIERNREKLRKTVTQLIQIVGRDEEKAKAILKQIELIAQHVNMMILQDQVQPVVLPPPSAYQIPTNDEKMRIAYRLQGFNPKDNHVTQEITRRFGSNLKQGELVGIAQVIAEKAQIKLDRDAKRRKNVLLKWFSENWETITPFLDYIVLEDNDNKGGENQKETEDSDSAENDSNEDE